MDTSFFEDIYRTPTTKECFIFPPKSCLTKSVDRQKKVRFEDSALVRSRRSFTPYKSSLVIKTPEVSPIEFSFNKLKKDIVRLPPESVCKAPADSTVDISEYVPEQVEEIRLMPPPYRRPFRTTSFNTGVSTNFFKGESNKHLSPLEVKQTRDKQLLEWKRNQDAFRLPKSIQNKIVSPDEKQTFLNKRICLSTTLAYIGLRKYIKLFLEEEIDFNIFLTLTDENLITIGVSDQRDRQTILNFIKEFSSGRYS